MDEKDLTFVFQGPEVFLNNENLTLRAIKKTRQMFPNSPIIFSTWDGVETDKYLEFQVKAVLSKDPGSVYRDKENNILMNLNRQMRSASRGLSESTTKYSVKLRSDLVPRNRNILKCLNSPEIFYPRNPIYSKTTNRVVVLDVTSIDPKLEEPLPFHPCDWFYAGLTSDLRLFFPLGRSCDEETISLYYEQNQKPENNPFPSSLARYHPESWIFVEAVKDFMDFDFKHLSDISGENIDISENLIYNNLMIASLRKTGWKSLKHKIKIMNYTRTYSTSSWKTIGKIKKSRMSLLEVRLLTARTQKTINRSANFLRRNLVKLRKYYRA